MRLIAALLMVSIIAALSNTANAAEKPNIIVIMADDLGYGDVGCNGATELKTPNIDQLAAKGPAFYERILLRVDMHADAFFVFDWKVRVSPARRRNRAAQRHGLDQTRHRDDCIAFEEVRLCRPPWLESGI